MERLLRYLEALDPEILGGIEGAEDDEIDALERLAGRPLPASYRDFLRTFGCDLDWIELGGPTFSISAVARAYQHERWSLPADLIGIGVARREPRTDVFLQSTGDGEPRVVSIPLTEPEEAEEVRAHAERELAGSIEELIGTEAFRVLRVGAMRFRATLAQRRLRGGELPRATTLAESLDFERLWFSTSSGCSFDRGDAALIATQRARSMLIVELAAETEAELERLRARFAAELDLVRG
ncbi:SMI1/KNR4 family protein [Sorangium sp. So ce429]